MDSYRIDLLQGLRFLARRPGFTAVASLTLALGIGANSAIFSVVNAVLLRPLPLSDPDRLMAVWETVPERGPFRVAPANYFDWRRENRSFEGLAAFGAATVGLSDEVGEPEQLLGAHVSANYFSVLGVEPVLGRSFLPEEERRDSQIVLLGHGVWRRRFGGDRQIVSRKVMLDGAPYTVVGITPPGIYPTWPRTSARVTFRPEQQQFLDPAAGGREGLQAAKPRAGGGGPAPAGRHARAGAAGHGKARRTARQQYPETNEGEGILLRPLRDEVVGEVRPALLTLLAATVLVLLVAGANVMSLLLARSVARRREVAVRSALGAGSRRLFRQFASECFLLAGAGDGLGALLAVWALGLVKRVAPQQIPRLEELSVDWTVFAFALLLGLGSALVFALVAAWDAGRLDLGQTLKEAGGASTQRASRRSRRLLVVAQVAVAVVLATSAGLLSRSFWELSRVDPGFNPDRVLTVDLVLPPAGYPDWRRVSSFYAELLERLRGLTDVRSASLA
jgi:putative ABC transport system permease protein